MRSIRSRRLSRAKTTRARVEVLERLENDSVVQSVPRSYTAEVYQLRRDIDLVRRRVSAAIETLSEGTTEQRV